MLIFQKNLDDLAVPSHGVKNDQSANEDFDFEKALKSEVKEMKSKNKNVIAIRNDVKGVVFFKACNDLDVNHIFDKLIQMVTSKSWKPK